MTRYFTKTGSIYEVDEEKKQIRSTKGGAGTTRVTKDWRSYEELHVGVSGLHIYWGRGCDETSQRLGTDPTMDPWRWTDTSPIVKSEVA